MLNEVISNNLIWIVSVAIIILGLLFYFKRSNKRNNKKSVYKKRVFLTKNEQDCFLHLKKILPDFHICPQVSMGAVIEPNLFKNKSQQTILRNKVQSKVIDFVVLNHSNMEIAFVIELDDNSHNSKQKEDKLRDSTLFYAGIYTARFRRNNGKFPSRKEILDQLLR